MKHISRRHIQKLLNNPIFVNVVIMISSLCLIAFLFITNAFDGYYNYEVGSEVKDDIYLANDVIDVAETERLRDVAIRNVDPVMSTDFSKLVESKKQLTDFFTTLADIKASYTDDKELLKRVYAGIEKYNGFELTEDELYTLALLSQERTLTLQNYATDITSENMTNGLTTETLEDVNTNIDTFIDTLTDLREVEQVILKKLVHGVLVPNRFIDEIKTADRETLAAGQVSEVVYKKGTLLAYKGEVLSEKQFQILTDGKMLYSALDTKQTIVLGNIIVAILLWLVMHYFLYAFHISILKTTKLYGMLMVIFLLTMCTAPFFMSISPYLIPLPMFGMLISIMLKPSIAIPSGMVLVAMVSLWLGLDVNFTLMYLTAMLIGILLSKNIRQRSQLMMNGVYTALVLAIFAVSSFLMHQSDYAILPPIVTFTLINGILCSILTIGIMPIFETLFSALTPFKLLELSNPNREILKRLMIEAPGTYHHSILVGNLAETAAHDIGADNVLARVASFYHDIGKLERPYYFKENQIGSDNPHDKLPPQVSASILKQHTLYGVELAKEHKLPIEIQEIIASHHGTSIIKFFFHIEQKKNPDADYMPFTYEGPKPQTKEAAIVMLADSVEAAVRSLNNPTKDNVKDLVDKIVQQKIDETQLDEANITLKEIETVKNSFLKVLSGIFHERIAYPEIALPSRSIRANENREAQIEIVDEGTAKESLELNPNTNDTNDANEKNRETNQN